VFEVKNILMAGTMLNKKLPINSEATTLQFGTTKVEVFPDQTLITFEDGFAVPGAPEDTDEYRATAEKFGYGSDTLKLCQEHEVMHIALCHWLGVKSPTMRRLQTNDDSLAKLNRLEEAAILALQRFARECNIDLVERMQEVLADETMMPVRKAA
jgi:hypothetical protein